MSAILASLAAKLANGPIQIGQVLVRDNFSLRHIEDADASELEVFACPEAAIDIARFDACGHYRPLKTAPNLKQGWEIRLGSLSETRLALDFFYPAALGKALALERGGLQTTDLRETLARQTGMYAVAKKISDDEARTLICQTCDHTSKCRNTILWSIAPRVPTPLTQTTDTGLKEPFPLLCTEACPLLIGAARAIVKARSHPGN